MQRSADVEVPELWVEDEKGEDTCLSGNKIEENAHPRMIDSRMGIALLQCQIFLNKFTIAFN